MRNPSRSLPGGSEITRFDLKRECPANNTIVMAANGGWALNLAQSGCVSNVVRNNILYNYHPWRGSIMIAAPAPEGFQSDYNVVVSSFSTNAGGDRISFAAWQAQGYDANSFMATPASLFVNYPSDCHLSVGSPAIDAGTEVPVVTNDIAGVARPLDGRNDGSVGWDIGAHEFVHSLADSDRDGMPDRDELTAGSNPADARSRFAIEAVRMDQGDGVMLEWRGVSGRTYGLSEATNPTSGFGFLTNGIRATPPRNSHTTRTDSVPFGFFRLNVQHE